MNRKPEVDHEVRHNVRKVKHMRRIETSNSAFGIAAGEIVTIVREYWRNGENMVLTSDGREIPDVFTSDPL